MASPPAAGATWKKWKSKLRSRGLLEAILDDFWRQINDFGSKMGSKSIQNESKMAPKRIPDRVFDSELVFQSIFIDFWAVFWMIFRCCFGSSHHVNEKCECSESPHFYNRFCRFYCSAEVWKSLKKSLKNYVNVHVLATPQNHPKNHLQKAPKWLQNQ